MSSRFAAGETELGQSAALGAGCRAGRWVTAMVLTSITGVTGIVAPWSFAAPAPLPCPMATQGSAEVYPVSAFLIRYHKDVGMRPFEDPAQTFADVTALINEYLAANPADPFDLRSLEAPLMRLGTAVVEPPPGASGATVVSFDIAGLREDGINQMYRSAGRVIREAIRTQRQATTGASPEAIAAIDSLLESMSFLDEASNDRPQAPFELDTIGVRLAEVDGVLTAAGPGEGVLIQLPAIPTYGAIDASALAAITDAIRQRIADAYANRVEVFVAPAPAAIDPATGADRRRGNDGVLPIIVAYVGAPNTTPFEVSSFTLQYATLPGFSAEESAQFVRGNPALPVPESVLERTSVTLYEVTDANGQPFLVDWHPGAPAVEFRPAQVTPSDPARLSTSAVRAVIEGVLAQLQADDLMAVFVDLERGQLDGYGGDVRPAGDTAIRLQVTPGIVNSVRTVASGERISPEERINNPAHARFREGSPIQPGRPETSVLTKKQLQDYLDLISRHPNRRVDAAVTPGLMPENVPVDESMPPPGSVGLDYLVSENKPWLLYAQGGNTGTASTGEWQVRFGFLHTDLFGNDEIFSVEYISDSEFTDSQAFTGYFDAKVGNSDRLRWKVYGSWAEYTAADVGFPGRNFTGTTYGVGGELAWNFLQHDKMFLDLVGGVRYYNAFVDNQFVQVTGEQDFLVPYAGIRAQRYARDAITDMSVFCEFDVPNATDVSEEELTRLGRLFPSKQYEILRWDLLQSFYLDPLFQKDPRQGTLAHELYFRFRGQYAFDSRLIPQESGILGGLYTIRGYPQAIVAGDTVLIGNAEYRLHVPYLLGFDPNPQPLFGIGEPFRISPQFGYGSADWDLILRAFFDIGQTIQSDPLFFEQNDFLMGAGIGFEVQVRRNLNIRVDWGFALKEIPGLVNEGSNRLYFVGTLSF